MAHNFLQTDIDLIPDDNKIIRQEIRCKGKSY